MTQGRTGRRHVLAGESPAPRSASVEEHTPVEKSVAAEKRTAADKRTGADKRTEAEKRTADDPRWPGIVEVLVSGLGGAVRWESGSVVLNLPDHPRQDSVADLEALRLCLGLIGVPVVFDASQVSLPDASVVEFLKKLAASGLAVNLGRLAA